MACQDCLPIAEALRREDVNLRADGVFVHNWFDYGDLDTVGCYLEVCTLSLRSKRLYSVQRYYCADYDVFLTLVQKYVEFANIRKTLSVRICDYECWDGALYSSYTKLAGDFVCL